MAASDLSAKAQQTLGLPLGFKTFSPYPFAGLNTQDAPIAIDDKEFPWIENFIRLGSGNLRTAWDRGLSIYTSPYNIVYFAFYSLGTQYYVAVFLSDGSAVQINTTTLAQTEIGISGTFYTTSGLLPYGRQWGTQYLLICNRNTPNDYWIWDGTLLYKSGTAAPNGVTITGGGFNYQSVPSVTVFGGEGSGIALTPVIENGAVVELNITNPGSGYQVGDSVQVALFLFF